MSLITRVGRAGLGLLGLGIMLMLGAAILGVASERGSRFTANVMAGMSGGAVGFDRFDGRLAGGFQVQGLRVELPGFLFRCESLAMDWKPSALIEGVFRIRHVALHRPILEIPESGGPKERALHLPSLAVAVAVDELTIDHATIIRGTQPIVLDGLTLSVDWQADRIAIGRLGVGYGPHRLAGYLALDVRREPRLAARLNWTGPVADVAGSATISVVGPIAQAALNAAFHTVAAGRFGGTITLIPARPSLAISGALDPISIPVSDKDSVGVDQITFAIAGDLDQLHIETSERVHPPSGPNVDFASTITLAASNRNYSSVAGVFDWHATPLSGSPAGPLTGRGDLRLKDGVIRLTHHTEPPYRTEILATLRGDPANPTLEATISWSDIEMHLTDDLLISSPAAKVSISGVVPDMDIAMTASIDETRLGRTELAWRGHVDGQALQLQELSAATLGGEIKAHGRLDWAPAVHGRFAISGAGIDLSRIRPETPTRLAFNGEVALDDTDKGLVTDLRVLGLSGSWRRHAIAGKGRLHVEPGAVTVDEFQLSAGDNALSVSGRLAQRMDGAFKLALSDLSVFDEKLGGALTGAGRVSGDGSAPVVTATIAGRGLAWEAIGVADLSAEIDVDLSKDLNSTISIRANSVDYDTLHLDSVSVSAAGTKNKHHIALDIDGPHEQIRAVLNGAWTGPVWEAVLSEQSLDIAPIGRWTLGGPARLRITADHDISLTPMCLVQQTSSVCADEVHWSPVSGGANVRYTDIPLGILGHWLPAHVRIAGVVNGDVVVGTKGAKLSLTGRTEVKDARVLISGYGEFAKDIPVEGFAARYEVSPRAYRAEFSATIPDRLAAKADVDINRIENNSLLANINVNSNNLSWLGDIFPAFNGTAGAFGLEATVAGTLTAPELRARGRLGSGQIVLPDIGLRLGGLEFSADTDAHNTVSFDARAVAGAKQLDLAGRITPDPQQGWRYRVSAQGNDFPLIRLPEMEVDISPDMTLDGERGRAHASGRIGIPHLYFELLTLPETATAVSEDQVLIGPDGAPIEQIQTNNAPLVYYRERLSADLELVLGDDIEVKGLGLSTALSGDVRLNKNRGHLGQAEGKVRLKGGVFKVYGQKLTIEKGQFLFAGPIDNPNLNIRAVRPNIDVVAGVRVTGTARDPRIDIFSEPPMSDAEKLSYILTGRPMTNASKTDASLIAQAALGFGLEHSSVITNEVRDLFQLDDLGLSGGDTVADTALVAGKQLSPRLSIRSEMNLFDQLWSFFLHYKLTDSWSLEAESGIRQGADVLYNIERDSLLSEPQ